MGSRRRGKKRARTTKRTRRRHHPTRRWIDEEDDAPPYKPRSVPLEERPGIDHVRQLLQSSVGSRKTNLLRLLAAIATEELALAHLINTEAEKTQAVKENIKTPFTPEEVIEFQHSVSAVITQVVKKEEILLKKMRLLVSILQEEAVEDYSDEKCDGDEDERDFDDEEDFDEDDFQDDAEYEDEEAGGPDGRTRSREHSFWDQEF